MTIREGKALCHQLSLKFVGFIDHASFGKGNFAAPIVALKCNQDNMKIKDCNIKLLNTTSGCNHANDAGILCLSKDY